MPKPAARPQVLPHPLLELRGEALHPAVHGRVVDLDTAVCQHQLEVAVADRELQVPRTAHKITSAGKRKPRNARASIMSSTLESMMRECRSYPLTGRRSTQRNPLQPSVRLARRVCLQVQ
jgi:hypothetical protein